MNEIRPFDGFKPMQEQFREQLPVGGYVCQIINAQAETRPDGDQQLAVMVEVAEGPYTNYFHRDYEAQQNRLYGPKYHGIARVLCPANQMRPEDAWIIDRFNLSIGAIMSSNPGYTWNWDPASLKGLMVGISVRENEYRGNIYTEIGKLIPISMIRDGSFRPMKRRISQESGIVQGYPPVSYAQSPTPIAGGQPAIMPRVTGYPMPQVQAATPMSMAVPPEEIPDPAPAAAPITPPALPTGYSDTKDIPF